MDAVLLGYTLRFLDGSESGLWATEELARAALLQLEAADHSLEPGDWSVVEVWE